MTKEKTSDNTMLKNIDHKKLSAETRQVTEAIKHLMTLYEYYSDYQSH